jgi:hypothetical protein
VLETLSRGASECCGDGIAVLAIEVGEEPCNVALQGVAALRAAKQWGEGLEELGNLRQGIAGSFGYGVGYFRLLVHAHQHTALITK